jgi:hypothetical protein
MWFEQLTGFKEESPEQVRENLVLTDDKLTSKINGRTFQCGTLEIPTLKALEHSCQPITIYKDQLTIAETVGNVRALHALSEHQGGMFQAASQFNLLEMVSPSVTPEMGITRYEYDHTQGPACAIACGAGTIYRNYFVQLGDQIGQTSHRQVDCLAEIGKALDNETHLLWQMKNGYAFANQDGLANISAQIKSMSTAEYEDLKGKLQIGLQWNTEVTISPERQTVSQAYCSALPIGYSQVNIDLWEDFARLILEASYECTFYAALKNYERTGSRKLFLTLVGGGVFGNKLSWIFNAIEKAVIKFRHTPIDVHIVSYGSSNLAVGAFVERLNRIS